MKQVLIILSAIILASCGNNNILEEAYFEFGDSGYWVYQIDEENTPEADAKKQAHHNTNPQQPTYHFFFNRNIQDFKTGRFNLGSFTSAIDQAKPVYGYYMLPGERELTSVY